VGELAFSFIKGTTEVGFAFLGCCERTQAQQIKIKASTLRGVFVWEISTALIPHASQSYRLPQS
jgi:hypothetical protein